MARGYKKAKIEEAEGLNLTPIMNMVLVLIPLMLLNVVFMTITVINVTMPQRSAGAAQNNNGEPPKRLQLFISKNGFTIVKGTEVLPAEAPCPDGGPTICPNNPQGEIEVDKHNWLALYNKLYDIKKEWPEHNTIEIVADSSINFGMIVKAMDVSRNQLTTSDEGVSGERINTIEEFNSAHAPLVDAEEEGAKMPLAMFSEVVLGLPTVTQ